MPTRTVRAGCSPPPEDPGGLFDFAEGSALITLGKTVVLCAVSVEDRQPPFLRGTTQGWVTAEYAMLPRSTLTRSQRESVAGRIEGGRTRSSG